MKCGFIVLCWASISVACGSEFLTAFFSSFFQLTDSDTHIQIMGANPIKTSPPPFLVKTYAVVEDRATDDIVSWNDDGTAFIVWRPAEFARELLPKLFKHSNFSSFVRQLNTYGFHKITTTRWEFSNDMFRKGELDRLRYIHRKQASVQKPQQGPPPSEAEENDDQRSSSTSSSSEFTTVADENKRLKQENQALSSELAAMQRRCKELLELTAIHGRGSPEKEEANGGPKLFGVRLEVKNNL